LLMEKKTTILIFTLAAEDDADKAIERDDY
jgi:hypothetical protein